MYERRVKPNPPVNVISEKAMRDIERGDRQVRLLYRDKLAERLGVSPKERVSMKLIEAAEPVDGKIMLLVSVLIDGGDLTPAQETILQAYLQEVGVNTLFVVPERPVTS